MGPLEKPHSLSERRKSKFFWTFFEWSGSKRTCRVKKKIQKTLIFSLWGNCTVLPFLAYCDRLGGQEQFHKVVSTLIELSNHFHYVTWRDNLLDEALWVILEQKAAQKNIENSRLSAKCLKLWDMRFFFKHCGQNPQDFSIYKERPWNSKFSGLFGAFFYFFWALIFS